MNSLPHKDTLPAFSLIELVTALGIFAVIAVTGTTLIVGAFSISVQAKLFDQATKRAEEGIAAVTSMRDVAWSSLTAGSHGLLLSSGVWSFSGTSDTADGLTRVVVVSDVQRDGSGSIVTSGGTSDSETKKITSTVTWLAGPGRTASTSLISYLTDWRTSRATGSATGTGGGCVTQASCIAIDTTNAILQSGGRNLEAITITNTSTASATVTHVTVSWVGVQLLESVTTVIINGNNVFNATAANGVEIDITDVLLPTGTTPLDRIRFTANMTGAVFSVTLKFSDNSTKAALGFTAL